MKAVTFDKTGGIEVLQYTDVERPTPSQVRSTLWLVLFQIQFQAVGHV
jgi:NADPH:quinone reductase-like Zn-dependent oxidoreductase